MCLQKSTDVQYCIYITRYHVFTKHFNIFQDKFIVGISFMTCFISYLLYKIKIILFIQRPSKVALSIKRKERQNAHIGKTHAKTAELHEHISRKVFLEKAYPICF